MNRSPDTPATLNRPTIAFLVGVPIAWAALLLFHPTGDGDQYYPIVKDQITPWLTVHLGTMLFIPLMAAVVFVLLRGIHGTAARVSRIALPFFVVFYSAFEVLVGIGNGILAHEVNALPAAERAVGSELIQGFNESPFITDPGVFTTTGSVAWLVAAVAAGVALVRRTGAPRTIPVLFGLSAPLIAIHVTPFGPVGLAMFIAAVALFVRHQAVDRAAAPLAQPRLA